MKKQLLRIRVRRSEGQEAPTAITEDRSGRGDEEQRTATCFVGFACNCDKCGPIV